MPISEKLMSRFAELEREIEQLKVTGVGEIGSYYAEAEWRAWAASAHHLIGLAFGEGSTFFSKFSKAYSDCTGYTYGVEPMKGIFIAAKTNYEQGLALSAQAEISGEVYGDFVGLAKSALAEGYKDVASVLACAALEDSLKRLALMNGLDVGTKSMQEVVSALKANGLVSGAQKSLLDAMPKVRDYAMHANWGKLTEQDVGSVIGFVEQLLLTRFS